MSAIGEGDVALKELIAFSKQNGTYETGPVRKFIDLLEAGQSLGALLTPQQEAARALTEPAFGFFVANRALDAGEVFLRMALTLDPEHDQGVLWLGELLENTEREDEAMALYQGLPSDSD